MSIPIHITVIRRARPFDIDSCTESELRRRCRERGLSAENTELAIEFFVKKTMIREIIENGSKEQMIRLEEVLSEAVCLLDERDYAEIECEIHKILYGDHLGETMAKEWVRKMENKDGTQGGHWTPEQTDAVRRQYCPSADPWDFYSVLNSVYSDYYNPKFGTDIYAEMAADFIRDEDAKPGKTLYYYLQIVK